MIKRNLYLNEFIKAIDINKIKIITGIRRCGKSYLLFNIFKKYLLDNGIKDNQFILIELDKKEYFELRNPKRLIEYIDSKINKRKKMFLFIDEVQLIDGVKHNPGLLYSVLRSYSDIKNLNVYITGSNSKFLSKDIETEFRGRGHIIRIHPLSYKEYYEFIDNKKNALRDYATYGGMPGVYEFKDRNDQINELNNYFNNVYINDIVDRYHIENPHYLNLIISELASSIGSLASPTSIYKSLVANGYKEISLDTVSNYFIYLEESFLFSKSIQYNVKGKGYFKTKYKFYMEDMGLRNSKLGFRQLEPTHIYENIVYLELIRRGFLVDVGVIPKYEKDKDNKTILKEYEVDFIASKDPLKFYIQYVYHLENEDKYIQEIQSFKNIDDGYQKIIITNDEVLSKYTKDGYLTINIEEFLLNDQIFGE